MDLKSTPLRRSTLLAVGALAVALLGVAVVVSGRGDGPTTRSPRPSEGTDRALTAEGRELTDLLTKGLHGTYHARYQSTLSDPRSTEALVLMDIWRKGDLGRQEVAVQVQGTRSRTATFLLPPQTVECSQTGDAAWTCKPPKQAQPPEAPEVQVQKVLAAGPITARDDKVAGLPVRCFTYPPSEDIDETCLLPDGVLARMITSSSRFDLIAMTPTVPDEVFAVPAPSASPGT